MRGRADVIRAQDLDGAASTQRVCFRRHTCGCQHAAYACQKPHLGVRGRADVNRARMHGEVGPMSIAEKQSRCQSLRSRVCHKTQQLGRVALEASGLPAGVAIEVEPIQTTCVRRRVSEDTPDLRCSADVNRARDLHGASSGTGLRGRADCAASTQRRCVSQDTPRLRGRADVNRAQGLDGAAHMRRRCVP